MPEGLCCYQDGTWAKAAAEGSCLGLGPATAGSCSDVQRLQLYKDHWESAVLSHPHPSLAPGMTAPAPH